MLKFIEITNRVMQEEIPNILIKEVMYYEELNYGLGTIQTIAIKFLDLHFNEKDIMFSYNNEPHPLSSEADGRLELEFRAYLDEHVKPILK